MRPLNHPSGTGIVISAAILLLAMTGSATASHLITSRQIKNGTIVAKDVKKNALGTSRIRNGSLTGADIRNGSLGLADLSASARNALSPPEGAGISGYQVVSRGSSDIAPGGYHSETATCPAGTEPLGAGVEWAGHTDVSVPFVDTLTGSGWYVSGTNTTSGSIRMVVRLICARVSS